NVVLCTNFDFETADFTQPGGGTYSPTGGDAAALTAELVNDIDEALTSWEGVTGADGTLLSFAATTTNNACAATAPDGTTYIRFDAMNDIEGSKPIALATVTYETELADGELIMKSGLIRFNPGSSNIYSTQACIDDLGCNPLTAHLSFAGVLTH